VNNQWYAALSFPVYGRLPLTIQERVPFAFAQGDLSVSSAWIHHTNRGQHRLGIDWTFPTGLSNEAAEASSSIPTGGTLHRFNLSWQYTRYTDPVSLSFGTSLGSSFPGTFAGSSYWEPASFSVSLGSTLLVNRWVAFAVNLAPSLSLPPRSGDQWISEYILYQNNLAWSFWYTDQDHTFCIEIKQNMASPQEGLGVSVRYFYSVKPKQSKGGQ